MTTNVEIVYPGPPGPPGLTGPPGPPGPPGSPPGVALISDTPPVGAAVGALWVESDTGNLYAWWDDGSSAAWVQVSGPLGAVAVGPPGADGGMFDTVAQVALTSIPSTTNAIQTSGYAAAGDGGGALYKRVASAPAHAGKVPSMDGAWWELAEKEINPLMLGGVMTDALAAAAALGACVRVTSEIAIPLAGCAWPANVKVTGHGKLKRVAGTVTGPMLSATAAGDYRVEGIEIEDNGTSAQIGMIEVFHASAVIHIRNIKAHGGYSGLWVKQAALVSDIGSEYYDTSHNIYLGRNDGVATSVDKASFTDVVSHNATGAGDGMKTVSGVRKLIVNGGRYYNNAADGIDCYAGADEVVITNAELSGNAVTGVDIKIGVPASETFADWVYRRRIHVTNCLVANNAIQGIKVDGSTAGGIFEDVLIAYNMVVGNANHALQITSGVGVQIIGNRCLGNGSAGGRSVIYVLADGATNSKGVVIANNVIGDNGAAAVNTTAINVTGCTDAVVTGNVIGNENRQGLAARLTTGLVVGTGSTNVYVDGNIFGSLVTNKVVLSAGTTILGDNVGIVTLSRGQATILNATASITFNHGLVGRPTASQVSYRFNTKTAGLTSVNTGVTSATTAAVHGYGTAGAANPTADCLIDWTADLRGIVNTNAITF